MASRTFSGSTPKMSASLATSDTSNDFLGFYVSDKIQSV
ncbi:hypothetical protein Javan420_0009 [Streptococcus phage Javan420]|nr:hypothetical protein Javan420_0009 [Streptococcus phage Javan420]